MDKYSILNKINSSDDVKKIPTSELNQLCSEIRNFLIENVSNTGGHLASNLGVVELTVAMHRVFDSTKDRMIFDVGHQIYVHKLLTGRRNQFSKLRHLNGISGFPKPFESESDPFVGGHASTSVSVGLGMVRAAEMLKQDYNVVCVIGDGALTGGMAYEALNDAGQRNEPIIVIFNDNDMSINESVGALSKGFAKLRCNQKYLRAKESIKSICSKSKFGNKLIGFMRKIKSSVKSLFLQNSWFEQMGFYYLGPADGHDCETLTRMLKYARDLKKPVLLHIKTTKGKGYKFAETCPENFHNISKFDVATGKVSKPACKTFSDVFGDTLCEIAKTNDKVCAITAAMKSGTGLSKFADEYPDRFFDVGIAEEHAVSMAAGMAKQGMKPVFAVYSTFLQRSIDQIINDTSLLSLPVVFAVDRAGIVGNDGETHNGVFDIPLLSNIPNVQIYCPSNYSELSSMLSEMLNSQKYGPCVIRYPRGCEGEFSEDVSASDDVVLYTGSDLTIVSYGIMINNAKKAADMLKKDGYSVELIKLNKIAPLDISSIKNSVLKTSKLMVLEDCIQSGCIGERIASMLFAEGISLKFFRTVNIRQPFLCAANVDELYKLCGIDEKTVYKIGLEALKIEGKEKIG